MKLTKIAAIVALAAAGSANAAIITTLGNAEIFLSAYDTAETKSFIYDTGINVSHLIDGSINASINIGADANWTSFVSSVGGVSNINWAVTAIQNAGGINTKFIYETLNQSASVGAAGFNSAFIGNINPEITTLTNVSAGTVLPATSLSSIELAGTAGYIGSGYDGFSSVGVASTTNKLNVGNVSFFGAADSNTAKSAAHITEFAAPTVVANFSTTSGSAVLTIGAVTPAVPEPTTSALALAALAGIGFVARRRAK